jgi:hypothetical protein
MVRRACFIRLIHLLWCGGILLGGCATGNRVLVGTELVVSPASLSWAEQEIIAKRGVSLYRLVPENEVNPLHHRAALVQGKGEMRGVVVEKSPIASGRYAAGKVQFTLPRDFEPSTHCFAVVAASGYVIATSSVGSEDKRFLLGLYPYSNKYRPRQGSESLGRDTNKTYTGPDLECEGTLNDFVSRHLRLYTVGTP